MLARCEAWQAVAAPGETAGTDAAVDATLDRLHVLDLETDPETLAGLRPFALVYLTDEYDAEQIAGGAQNYLDRGGALGLYLCDLDRERDESAAARYRSAARFIKIVDGVVLDFRVKAQIGENLPIREIRLLQRPRRSPRADDFSDGAFFDVALGVRWK